MKKKSLSKKEWVTLVEGAQLGNQEAFEELCRLKTPNIMFLCKSSLNNWEDAEDAAQEVLIKMQKDIKNLIKPEAFPSWLDRMCINICLTMRRKRMKEQFDTLSEDSDSDYQDFSPEAFPADVIESAESRNMVMQAIDSLPYSFRMALILHYYEDLTAAEIADVMNITLAMAKHNIQRGRQALKNIIRVEGHSNKYIAMSSALPFVINQTDMIVSAQRSANVLKAAGIPPTSPVKKTSLALSLSLLAMLSALVVSGIIATAAISGNGSLPNPFHFLGGQNNILPAASVIPSENPTHLILPSTSPIAGSTAESAPRLSQNESSMGEEQGKSSSSIPDTVNAGAALMGQIFLNSPNGPAGTFPSSIDGITVELVSAKPPYKVVKTTKTMGGEHSGWYMFENLEPGNYLIRPLLPAHFQPLPQGENIVKNGYICCKEQTVFTLKSGKPLTVSLPVYQTGSISGAILASQPELNNQLSGIIVKLYDKNNALLLQTVTNADGSYELQYPPIIKTDTYYLRFYVPANMGMSLEANTTSVSFVPGENKTAAPNTVTDSMPPSLHVVAHNNPDNPAIIRADAFEIHTFDTGNVAIRWTLEDGAATVASGSSTGAGDTLDELAAGIYVLHVTATDRVGNSTTFQTIVCLG